MIAWPSGWLLQLGSWPSRRSRATARRCRRTGTAACTRTSRAGRGRRRRTPRVARPTARPADRRARARRRRWPRPAPRPSRGRRRAARSTPTASSTPSTSPARNSRLYWSTVVGLVRRAVPAQVGHDHLVPRSDERRYLVAPHPAGVGEAVQQHHRRTLSGHLVVDADSVHVRGMGSPGSVVWGRAVRRRAARAARPGWGRGWGRRATRRRHRGCGR